MLLSQHFTCMIEPKTITKSQKHHRKNGEKRTFQSHKICNKHYENKQSIY